MAASDAVDAADVAASVATTKRQGVAAIARNQRNPRRRPKTTSRRGKPVAGDAVPGRATSDTQTSPSARKSMVGAADLFHHRVYGKAPGGSGAGCGRGNSCR